MATLIDTIVYLAEEALSNTPHTEVVLRDLDGSMERVSLTSMMDDIDYGECGDIGEDPKRVRKALETLLETLPKPAQRITGTINIVHDMTGEIRIIPVDFDVKERTPWDEIVDEAFRRVCPDRGCWILDMETLEETPQA